MLPRDESFVLHESERGASQRGFDLDTSGLLSKGYIAPHSYTF